MGALCGLEEVGAILVDRIDDKPTNVIDEARELGFGGELLLQLFERLGELLVGGFLVLCLLPFGRLAGLGKFTSDGHRHVVFPGLILLAELGFIAKPVKSLHDEGDGGGLLNFVPQQDVVKTRAGERRFHGAHLRGIQLLPFLRIHQREVCGIRLTDQLPRLRGIGHGPADALDLGDFEEVLVEPFLGFDRGFLEFFRHQIDIGGTAAEHVATGGGIEGPELTALFLLEFLADPQYAALGAFGIFEGQHRSGLSLGSSLFCRIEKTDTAELGGSNLHLLDDGQVVDGAQEFTELGEVRRIASAIGHDPNAILLLQLHGALRRLEGNGGDLIDGEVGQHPIPSGGITNLGHLPVAGAAEHEGKKSGDREADCQGNKLLGLHSKDLG